jgi:ribonuclease-3
MSETDRELRALCERLRYSFGNLEVLRQALRHPSYTHENPKAGEHNQRLEFLGDAVVGLVVAEALVRRFPDAREGQLTRWRAALVSERPLARAAKQIGLDTLVLLGKGEHSGGGRDRTSVLCDAFEAVTGAAFIDGGLDAARTLVEAVLGSALDTICADAQFDYKSQLQEWVQARCGVSPSYEVTSMSGPDHDRRFEVSIAVAGKVVASGTGTNKKTAEQDAARQALEQLGVEEESHEST